METPTPDAAAADVETGQQISDDEEWDEFPVASMGSSGGGCSTSCSGNGADRVASVPPEPEPDLEPEPEVDPFADFGMAPKIAPTKRHAAVSVWAKPAAPTSGTLAMDADGGGGGAAEWGADDGMDIGDFGVGERRRAAEERRQQRRQQRGEITKSSCSKEKPRLAAVRGAEF